MKVRLFIALPISDEIQKQCEVLQEIGRQMSAPVRWVAPRQIHLTLFFLGSTDTALQSMIEAEMREAAHQSAPFSVEVTGLGVFPHLSAPKVIWVGLSSEPMLLTLQKNISMRMAKIGFPPEERPYRPHLTLGRVKGVPSDTFSRWITEGRALRIGQCAMKVVSLVESCRSSEGSVYISRFSSPLGGA